MPPRIPIGQCLRAQTGSQCSQVSRAFSSTPSSQASTVAQKRKHRDPYAIVQAKARKAANLSRQEVLKKERAGTLGDPVRGIETPFVRSFDTAVPPELSPRTPSARISLSTLPAEDAPGAKTEHDSHLNFFLNKQELEHGVKRSRWLTQPLPEDKKTSIEDESGVDRSVSDGAESQNERTGLDDGSLFDSDTNDEIRKLLDNNTGPGSSDRPDWARSSSMLRDLTTESTPEAREKKLQEEHDIAKEALKRISSLSLGSSKDRLRVNTQRCVESFGRHNTDQTLPARPPSTAAADNQPEKFPRIGPDTGSSEVQIAILTAKIRALADGLALRGTPSDKMNKRNLRLLVHRRAKLMNYLRRKERGGPRWQNLVGTLGLTDGTWKGEISL
ncbi:hypothetical protein DOTSEDRAFT_70390 [Dothistroma septosporum NZE10]|uniref:Ribosomal protein S15-like protein n=1 Tax=Dothistroma septosporum (strain NZE10 / CBS 128990) TaxID=675120 RepID=N1PTU5_DOTSN|nr:hypothetical protein DOTSEDRAFT_70390 [Dothistroma septosporum NZE10]